MALCAAPPSGPGIVGGGFDLCRASPEAVESLFDASSNALFFLGGLVQSWGSHVSTMSPMASLADRCRLSAKSRKARANVVRFAPESGHSIDAPARLTPANRHGSARLKDPG